tara:strand:- start:108 stop:308 length:201 start_codon:yes stop_codon:yes gene_type:complete
MVPKIDPDTDKKAYRKMAKWIQSTLGYEGVGTPEPILLDADEVRVLGWITLQMQQIPLDVQPEQWQ